MFCVSFQKIWIDPCHIIRKIRYYVDLTIAYRCAQCFRPFPDGVFYEFEGRKYCEHDFHVLFAPCCGKCGKCHDSYHVMMSFHDIDTDVIHSDYFSGEFIVGRVIKAMSASWHPKCFTCEMCHKELADLGFVKNQGKLVTSYPIVKFIKCF